METNGQLSFSDNFDWINGGLKSETAEDGNNRQFVNIKAGSTMTINYPLFKQSARTAGKTVKIIFKATSCRRISGMPSSSLKCLM